MAANLNNDEERNMRIVMVGEYFLNNPETSTRLAAEYFSKNFFQISNATIHDYLERYRELMATNPDIVNQINNTMKNNKPENVDDEKVRQRVILACKMFMQDYKTIEQISEELGESYRTIYRDLTKRLEIVNPMLYKMVEAQLKNNSLSNLKNNNQK